jgi:ribosomal protein L37AE/L43A
MQAKKYGSVVIKANEYLTSKTCSNCGHIQTMDAKKIYDCGSCKKVMGAMTMPPETSMGNTKSTIGYWPLRFTRIHVNHAGSKIKTCMTSIVLGAL